MNTISAGISTQSQVVHRKAASGGLGALLRGGLQQVRLWRQRSRQRRDLLHLDTHLLQDVGLRREDVLRESGKPFWRR